MKTERSFFEIFEELEDPRDTRGKIYPLIDILILAIYGVLIGFEDFTNMAYYLKKREDELIKELDLSVGVPSHDVFSDVFRVIDVEKFMELFVEWTRGLVKQKTGKQIAIDGKAIKAARDKLNNGNMPYVISAFLCDAGLSIGQKKVGDKTNEITEIPKLLDLIDIEGALITIDAIGLQKEIMDKIVEKKGHFCLQLKKNNKKIFCEVDDYFRGLDLNGLDCFKSVEKDHGRIETRSYYIDDSSELMDYILENEKISHVKSVGMAVLTREENGKISKEIHYHLLDQQISAKLYSAYARNHWAIENSLHWILDIHFREDDSTARKDNALSNLTLLRKIAFNFTKLDPAMKNKTTKKKMIDYMTDISCFKHLIYDVVALS